MISLRNCFALVMVFCPLLFGADYYVDYAGGNDKNSGTAKTQAWKSCPALKTFSGVYHHRAGDRFVFRGGVTWPDSLLPLQISYSGTADNMDFYTTDRTWFAGSEFKQPIFDGNHKQVQLFVAQKESCFVVNDLHFADYGTSGIYNGGKALEIYACNRYTVANCTIKPQSWIAFYIHSFTGTVTGNIVIENNDISSAGTAIVVATEAPNTIIKNITLRNNSIHDLASQIVADTHGDGIHTWNSDSNDPSQYLTNLTICGNVFYGDFSRTGAGSAGMTSLIYLTDPGNDARIYNNVLSYSQATSFASLIWIREYDNVQVYNNTLVHPGPMGGIGIMVGQGHSSNNVVIKNNIICNFQNSYHIYQDASPTITINNNCCHTTSTAIGYWNEIAKDVISWKFLGNDRNGIFRNPQFLSSTDFHLASTSPCINAGDNAPATLFTNDKENSARTGIYDIGAYEYAGSRKPSSATILLLYPENTGTNVPLQINFRWREAEQATGDSVYYSLYASTDNNVDQSNPIIISTKPRLPGNGTFLFVPAFLALGLIVSDGKRLRWRLASIPIAVGFLVPVLLVISCARNPVGAAPKEQSILSPNLEPNTTYYWKVTAVTNNSNDEIESELWHFTTRQE